MFNFQDFFAACTGTFYPDRTIVTDEHPDEPLQPPTVINLVGFDLENHQVGA